MREGGEGGRMEGGKEGKGKGGQGRENKQTHAPAVPAAHNPRVRGRAVQN